MNKLCLLLSVLVLAVGAAYAHQDRILTIRQDGSIPEIPSSLGPVSLRISGLGKSAPMVQFSSGARRNVLPFCVTQLIHTRRLKDVSISGSWYHDESLLPYYVKVEFHEPDYVPSRPYNSSFNILFNLRTAEVIEIQRLVADSSGNGGRYEDVSLPKGCTLSRHAA